MLGPGDTHRIATGENLTVRRRHSDAVETVRTEIRPHSRSRCRNILRFAGILTGTVLAVFLAMAISPIDSGDISGVLAQMRQIAQSGALPSAQAPTTDFADVLKGSLARANDLHADAARLSEQFELGDSTASLQQVVIALEKASVSFEAVKGVRNRLLAAYQEIMNMQV